MNKSNKKQIRRLKSILNVQTKSKEEDRMLQSILARLNDIKASLPKKEKDTFAFLLNGREIFVIKGKLSKEEKILN